MSPLKRDLKGRLCDKSAISDFKVWRKYRILGSLQVAFVQQLCEYRDLLNKVAQLSGEMNGSGSVSKGSVRRIMTNKAKPTVSDAFRLQLQVLVEVLQSTNPWYALITVDMNTASQTFSPDATLDLTFAN